MAKKQTTSIITGILSGETNYTDEYQGLVNEARAELEEKYKGKDAPDDFQRMIDMMEIMSEKGADKFKYHDWFLKPFSKIEAQRDDLICGRETENPDKTSVPLPDKGTYMTVFNTIAKGDVAWEGTVDLEYERGFESYPTNPQYGQQAIFGMWVHGFDKACTPEEWASMFFAHMPAKLEKDGKVIYGALEPFFETGTEGVQWSITEYGKKGYEALHSVGSGDKLTVYNDVTEGNIVWQGELEFEHKEQEAQIYPANPHHKEIVRRKPKNIDDEQWAFMTSQNYPAKFEELKPTIKTQAVKLKI